MLFVKPVLDTTMSGRVTDESRLLEPYAGKTIGDITIERQQVFDPGGNWLERTANKTHMLTRDRVVRRDLLFRPGDKLDPQLIVRNKQLIRSRDYISDIDVTVLPDPADSTHVNLLITTRDSWTISVDGGWHSEGRTMVGLSDANIFGSGNKLKFMTNFSRKDFSYGGNMVEYEIPNLLGTFYTAEFGAGRDFYNSTLNLGMRKDFLKPTDYEIGLTYSDVKAKRYMIEQDTSLLVKERNLDVWGGYSHYLRGIRSSAYLSGRYNYRRVSRRPLVAPDYNPRAARPGRPAGQRGALPREILHGQHDLRIRYARVPRDGLQGRSDDGLFVGRIQRRPLPRHELRNRWFPRTGLHHGRLHARKLHRPRKRHVAAQRRRRRPAVVL